ncbi:hypothetical protein WA158_003278 [Blastocystis sp. Blastoise]
MKGFLVLLFVASVFALDNGLALTPPMGWMPWEQYRCTIDCKTHPDGCVNEDLFIKMTDKMVEDGYLEAGYDRINIDDCWSTHERDANHRLVPDPERFPHGMKYVGDYMHSKNIYFGIYNDYGTLTCEGYPGSKGYLEIDAETFASWGVDALKMDGCYSEVLDQMDAYPAMSYFLNATGRPILYSCSWAAYAGSTDNYKYYEMLPKYCNLWRNWWDIRPTWASIRQIMTVFGNTSLWFKYAGPGHWNDPDMIVIGMKDGLNKDESETQMAIWSVLAAPLYMTNDLRNITSWAKEILLNKEVIAVDQDPLGISGYRIGEAKNEEVWVRQLQNNEWAIVLLNSNDQPATVTTKFSEFTQVKSFALRNLFTHTDLGIFTESYTNEQVPPHGVIMLRAVPQN